jgi:NAD(P)-dependent dehydrogenase (short-subunit alcohol dehydrogenase family)
MRVVGVGALVTGAASGLGRATARHLLDLGAKVTLVDLSSTSADDIVAEFGGAAQFVAADVTDPGQVKAAVEAAAGFADLRVVANCAGVVTPGKLIGRHGPLDTATFLRVLAVNLGGTVSVMARAVAAMQRLPLLDGERGVIVNTSSVAAFDGQVGQIAYSASKAGVAGLCLPAARELAPSAIRVVTIAPGMFETPMMANLPPAARESLVASSLHPKRLGDPAEYAALVAHIVANPMLNGETIRLDGALRMAPT